MWIPSHLSLKLETQSKGKFILINHLPWDFLWTLWLLHSTQYKFSWWILCEYSHSPVLFPLFPPLVSLNPASSAFWNESKVVWCYLWNTLKGVLAGIANVKAAILSTVHLLKTNWNQQLLSHPTACRLTELWRNPSFLIILLWGWFSTSQSHFQTLHSYPCSQGLPLKD